MSTPNLQTNQFRENHPEENFEVDIIFLNTVKVNSFGEYPNEQKCQYEFSLSSIIVDKFAKNCKILCL